MFFCVLPAELSALAGAVLNTGGVPVLDFTCSARVDVPMVHGFVCTEHPGTGPVILAGTHKMPVRNRETWLEVTEPIAPPKGFAGVVLRGNEWAVPLEQNPV